MLGSHSSAGGTESLVEVMPSLLLAIIAILFRSSIPDRSGARKSAGMSRLNDTGTIGTSAALGKEDMSLLSHVSWHHTCLMLRFKPVAGLSFAFSSSHLLSAHYSRERSPSVDTQIRGHVADPPLPSPPWYNNAFVFIAR